MEVAMFSHTAPSGIGLHGLRTPPRRPQTPRAPARAAAPAAPATTWLERLAAWSERQPLHHHLGSCGRL